MKIRLAAYLQPDSIVDGEGVRTVIWTQGCPHSCEGCHNPETHDFNGGALIDIEEVKEIISSLDGQDGITFSGGDPFVQPEACAILARFAKSKGLNIWTYTGFKYEDIISMSKNNKGYMDFLKEIDVLVDGKFEISKRSYNCIFRGSTNQRIIDVKRSLEESKVVEISKYDLEQEEVSHRVKAVGVYI